MGVLTLLYESASGLHCGGPGFPLAESYAETMKTALKSPLFKGKTRIRYWKLEGFYLVSADPIVTLSFSPNSRP